MNEFVMIKKCTNCQSNNPPVRHICQCCHELLINEISVHEWSKRNNELENKRLEHEKQLKKKLGETKNE